MPINCELLRIGEMTMTETRSPWAKNVEEHIAIDNDTRPVPVRVVRKDFRVTPQIVVVLERLWYSLKTLVVGRSVTDVKTRHEYVRKDCP
jgi:hypothetical protein